MPPIPQKNSTTRKPAQPIRTTEVYDEYGVSVAELLNGQKLYDRKREREVAEDVTGVRQNTNTQQSAEVVNQEYQNVVFTDVAAGNIYLVTLDDLDWWTTGSYLIIGYDSDGTFTALVQETTLPEENAFTITLPDDEEISYVEVKIKGDGGTGIHLLNISDSEKTIHYDRSQNLTDDQKQRARTNMQAMIDLLDANVTLDSTQVTTILTKLGLQDVLTDISTLKGKVSDLEDDVADHERRIYALEHPQS